MFSSYFDGDYDTKRFWFKGVAEDIQKIKDDKEIYFEIESETSDGAFVTIGLSYDSYAEGLIEKYPDVMAIGFVEDWTTHEVYVAFSDFSSNTIDECERVGFYDRHSDFNWHDTTPITAENLEVEMKYNGEREIQIYNFPFANEWNIG